jgi:hypothetical protein
LQRFLDSVHLAAEPPSAVYQTGFMLGGVCHTAGEYTPLGYYVNPRQPDAALTPD